MSKAVVEHIKADLVARGVDLSGACGAAQITVRVAHTLRDRYGLLLKRAGNRAVFRADGTCVDGDHANPNEPGFATDYLIDRATFFGYDILSDGGGLNGPQWPDDPETTEVARNTANFAEAPNLDGTIDPPGPVDPPVDPPPHQDELAARVTVLEGRFADQLRTNDNLMGTLYGLTRRVTELEHAPPPVIELPALVAKGNTSRVWGHAHTVELDVVKKEQ